MKKDLWRREKDIQGQVAEDKIKEARYNKNKEIMVEETEPRYLEKERINKDWNKAGTRVLMRLRCGNMEQGNKYWLGEEKRICVLCERERDDIRHFVTECEIAKVSFKELGKWRRED